VVGLAGLLHVAGAGRALSAHPVAVLAGSVVLAVAGAAFQLPSAWTGGGQGTKGSAVERGAPAATA
jgi:hypothetical protein